MKNLIVLLFAVLISQSTFAGNKFLNKAVKLKDNGECRSSRTIITYFTDQNKKLRVFKKLCNANKRFALKMRFQDRSDPNAKFKVEYGPENLLHYKSTEDISGTGSVHTQYFGNCLRLKALARKLSGPSLSIRIKCRTKRWIDHLGVPWQTSITKGKLSIR